MKSHTAAQNSQSLILKKNKKDDQLQVNLMYKPVGQHQRLGTAY